MKKIIACMSLVFALSTGATALAAVDVIDSGEYHSSNNSLSVAGSGATNMNTVLITKDLDNDIVFADQNDSTFLGVTEFLLKGNSLDVGTYTVKMNTKDGGEATTKTFTIANNEPLTELAINAEEFRYPKKDYKGADVYDTGFKAEAVNLANIKFIAITSTLYGKTAYYPLDSNVSGTVNVAIRVNNIPDNDSVSVRLVGAIPSPTGNE